MQSNYMIVFSLNGDFYLLFTEHFIDDNFYFGPLCLTTLEMANDLFSEYRRIIPPAESLTDPDIVKQTVKLMTIRPVICHVTANEQELSNYIDGEIAGCTPTEELLNMPYTLVKVKPSFYQFAVFDVALDICSSMKVDPDGGINIIRSDRIFK